MDMRPLSETQKIETQRRKRADERAPSYHWETPKPRGGIREHEDTNKLSLRAQRSNPPLARKTLRAAIVLPVLPREAASSSYRRPRSDGVAVCSEQGRCAILWLWKEG